MTKIQLPTYLKFTVTRFPHTNDYHTNSLGNGPTQLRSIAISILIISVQNTTTQNAK